MSENVLQTKVKSLVEWQGILDEAEKEVNKLKDELKEEMDARSTEELRVGSHILRYKTIFSKRFQSKEFAKLHAELYEAFCSTISSRRFTCN